MKSDAWPAPAKINLFLHVVGRRADGYHLLQSHFQFLDFCDEIVYTPRKDGEIRRLNGLLDVPADEDLVVRAARLLQPYARPGSGADIDIDKRVPAGGGLGGGSSDAATTLVALNAIWQAGRSENQLAELGLALGADVPVFVRGAAAWAEGVGEHLIPLDADEGPILVVHPGCEVSTAKVFAHPELTRDTPAIKIHDLPCTAVANDCEAITRRLYPEVGRALDWLGQFAPARMSGTGACVFATFDTIGEAKQTADQLPASWAGFIADRRNVSPLLATKSAFEVRRTNA